MTATLAAPKAHRIGKPIMLTDAEVKKRRNRLEKRPLASGLFCVLEENMNELM